MTFLTMHPHAGILILVLLIGFTLRGIVANKRVKPATWKACWNSKAYSVVRDVSLQRCVEECQIRDRCKAVSYWRVRRNCELVDNDVNPLLGPPEGKPCLAIAKTDMSQTNECEDCSRVCGADSDRTTCLVKECFAPPVVDNGRFIGNKMNVGAWKKLVCEEWYRPEANVDRVQCQDDGGWGPTVNCLSTSFCTTPSSVTNAQLAAIRDPAPLGTEATYSCNPGYNAPPDKNNFRRTCLIGGTWSAVGFECQKDCASPPTKPNASPDTGGTLLGAVRHYTCNAGHLTQTGASGFSTTCQASGWSSTTEACFIECPDPPDITDATVAIGNKHESSLRTYTCSTDHHIKKTNKNLNHWYYEGTWDSSADVTCHNGAWNVDFDCIPSCAITCSCPLVINVQDSQLTASSYYQATSFNRPPRKAKLNSDNHWAAGSDTMNHYIQVDFEVVKRVTHVILQRSTDVRYYVTSYKVLVSTDCSNFQTVQGSGGGDKVFVGVDNTEDWVVQILDTPFQARCVRINPRTYHNWPSLRFGLLGCETNP